MYRSTRQFFFLRFDTLIVFSIIENPQIQMLSLWAQSVEKMIWSWLWGTIDQFLKISSNDTYTIVIISKRYMKTERLSVIYRSIAHRKLNKITYQQSSFLQTQKFAGSNTFRVSSFFFFKKMACHWHWTHNCAAMKRDPRMNFSQNVQFLMLYKMV